MSSILKPICENLGYNISLPSIHGMSGGGSLAAPVLYTHHQTSGDSYIHSNSRYITNANVIGGAIFDNLLDFVHTEVNQQKNKKPDNRITKRTKKYSNRKTTKHRHV